MPFLTAKGNLVESAVSAIKTVTGIDTELSTSGGTSDGRFIAPTGAQVLELGPTNATIHQVNECVGIDELDTLEDIYFNLLCNLLSQP
jgi:succinyl-diaminopimelate desuccinylase